MWPHGCDIVKLSWFAHPDNRSVGGGGWGTSWLFGLAQWREPGCLNLDDIPVVSRSNPWISMNWLRDPCSGLQKCQAHKTSCLSLQLWPTEWINRVKQSSSRWPMREKQLLWTETPIWPKGKNVATAEGAVSKYSIYMCQFCLKYSSKMFPFPTRANWAMPQHDSPSLPLPHRPALCHKLLTQSWALIPLIAQQALCYCKALLCLLSEFINWVYNSPTQSSNCQVWVHF